MKNGDDERPLFFFLTFFDLDHFFQKKKKNSEHTRPRPRKQTPQQPRPLDLLHCSKKTDLCNTEFPPRFFFLLLRFFFLFLFLSLLFPSLSQLKETIKKI